MRTTVELPPELMRTAKARAAERGESLKTWLTRAVAAALGETAPAGQPVPWPVFGKPSSRKVRVTGDDLAAAEAGDDAEKYQRGVQRSR